MSEVVLDADVVNGLVPFRRALRRAADELRRELPWIGIDDPWGVLVSEVMLQQTSTRRVSETWRLFLQAFPTPQSCASAPLGDVLRMWSGMGYPRRAKWLHAAAQVMVEHFDGAVPSTVEDLLGLPGVGPYTAHAVASFAFDLPVAVLDTNVGRVLSRALANRVLRAREAQALATALLPARDGSSFNQAMLDLGAQYCSSVPRCAGCPVRGACRFYREGGADPAPRSAAVSKPQAPFKGSDRQVRGRILKSLHDGPRIRDEMCTLLADVDASRLDAVLLQLETEGLVGRRRDRYSLGGAESTSG